MSKIEPHLAQSYQENPQSPQKVIITLAPESQSLKAADLGLSDVQEIGEGSGIYTGTFTGEKLLKLSQRHEIQEITPDIEVNMLNL
jgi:hypothetical protein